MQYCVCFSFKVEGSKVILDIQASLFSICYYKRTDTFLLGTKFFPKFSTYIRISLTLLPSSWKTVFVIAFALAVAHWNSIFEEQLKR